MIIDFHTHIFPDKIAESAIRSLEKSGGAKANIPATKDALTASMKTANIDYSVNMPIATSPRQTVSINNFAIKINNSDNLFSFGSIHPLFEDKQNELIRIKKNGIRGIKLHPDFQNIFIDDPKTVALIRAACDLGLYVLIHAGMDISFPNSHKSTPKRIHNILNRIDPSRLICAHMGGYNYLDDVEKYLMKSGVLIDTSFCIGKFDTNQIKRIINNFNPDNILFGTDSPWDSQKNALNNLLSLNINKNTTEKILYKNVQRILHSD